MVLLYRLDQYDFIGKIVPFILTFDNKRHYSTCMADMSFMSPDELQAVFGKQLQELRISKNLDQITTAEKAGISERALRNLEAGHGSSIETLVRVLKALDSLEGMRLLAPRPSVSPLALLRNAGAIRRRVRRSGIEANQG
jgi:transcriptional regulator with XRE-family HTH domain